MVCPFQFVGTATVFVGSCPPARKIFWLIMADMGAGVNRGTPGDLWVPALASQGTGLGLIDVAFWLRFEVGDIVAAERSVHARR